MQRPGRVQRASRERGRRARRRRSGAAPTSSRRASTQQLAWALDDHLATLRSALRDAANESDAAALAARLLAIATTCQRLAVEPDFGFLFNQKRRLFHIGFRVAEHQLDSGFYDLLASEARATSLWAIAKGDVPAGTGPRSAGRSMRSASWRACARGRARCSST